MGSTQLEGSPLQEPLMKRLTLFKNLSEQRFKITMLIPVQEYVIHLPVTV